MMNTHSGAKAVVFLLLLPFIWMITSCDLSELVVLNPPFDGGTEPIFEESIPQLQNLVVEFGEWNGETGQAGDFHFVSYEEKVFLEFGAEVEGPDGPKILPTFEYRVNSEANVLSPIDGVIADTLHQSEGSDVEVWIKPTSESSYVVIIDHVTDLQVSVGMEIPAGTILGKPGPWNQDLGRVELMVVKMDEGLTYAPFYMFDAELKVTYEQKVWQLMEDWETFKSDTTLYDQPAMEPYHAGCLAETYLQ